MLSCSIVVALDFFGTVVTFENLSASDPFHRRMYFYVPVPQATHGLWGSCILGENGMVSDRAHS